MPSRRAFLIASGLTAATSARAVGANGRIRLGFLGVGTRGSYLASIAEELADCEVVALCDVYKPNLEKAASALKTSKPDLYGDYRRVLERKDIHAVVIATPDHWHAPMIIEASEAGKDSYCEKPLSNSIEGGWKALEAARRYGRVVQIGLQQRSWDHFQKCCELVQSGMFGTIFHCKLHWQGYYTRPPEPPATPPPELDWEMFQGPAPRKPFTPSRFRNWRAYYDYGGGIITDQGVHVADVVHWYMKVREPKYAAAAAQYVNVPPNPECPPDSFQIAWQYEGFVMSFTNAYMPQTDYLADQGNYFFGTRGVLHINRQSYTYRPMPVRTGRGEPSTPPFEPFGTKFPYVGKPADVAHFRNWLDCIKTRATPITDIETGFYSTLPLLLALLAIRDGKTYYWDGKQARA